MGVASIQAGPESRGRWSRSKKPAREAVSRLKWPGSHPVIKSSSVKPRLGVVSVRIAPPRRRTLEPRLSDRSTHQPTFSAYRAARAGRRPRPSAPSSYAYCRIIGALTPCHGLNGGPGIRARLAPCGRRRWQARESADFRMTTGVASAIPHRREDARPDSVPRRPTCPAASGRPMSARNRATGQRARSGRRPPPVLPARASSLETSRAGDCGTRSAVRRPDGASPRDPQVLVPALASARSEPRPSGRQRSQKTPSHSATPYSPSAGPASLSSRRRDRMPLRFLRFSRVRRLRSTGPRDAAPASGHWTGWHAVAGGPAAGAPASCAAPGRG